MSVSPWLAAAAVAAATGAVIPAGTQLCPRRWRQRWCRPSPPRPPRRQRHSPCRRRRRTSMVLTGAAAGAVAAAVTVAVVPRPVAALGTQLPSRRRPRQGCPHRPPRQRRPQRHRWRPTPAHPPRRRRCRRRRRGCSTQRHRRRRTSAPPAASSPAVLRFPTERPDWVRTDSETGRLIDASHTSKGNG